MSDAYKTLAQAAPAAATLTPAYTVPAATATVVASATVCNQSATPDLFRVSVAVSDAADTAAQYLYYDLPISGNDTFIATIGATLAATDVVRVRSANGTCSFNFFGVERS